MPRLSAGSILALDALPRRLNLARSLRVVTIVALVGSTFAAPFPARGAPSAPPATRQESRPAMRSHPGWHAPRPRVHEASDEPAPSEHPLAARQSLASPAPAASQAGGTVYLATRVHVARSRDFYSASPHWEDVRGGLPLPLEPATGITEFSLDPFDPTQRAWVSYSGAFGHGSLWRADDLDAQQPTWKEVLNEAEILQATGKAPTSLLGALAVPGQGGPAGKAYATVMRVVASRLQPGLLFVAVSAEGRLYVGRSADYGESWTWSGSIGGASIAFELSDHDPDRLWVGTNGPWQIHVSEDGGKTFRLLVTFPQFWFLSDLYSPPAGNPDDQILFTIARTTTYFSDVLRSSDGGKSWSIVTKADAPPGQLNRTLGSDPSNAQRFFYTQAFCEGPSSHLTLGQREG